jgi:DNA-binding NarL/FixJ family response regulator
MNKQQRTAKPLTQKNSAPAKNDKGGRKPSIRVLIVDDHPLLRQGIAQLINAEPDMIVCGEADNAGRAMAAIPATKCDVAIVDISLSDSNGIELLKDIKALYPRLPVLILSMHDESVYAQRALRAGASGYIMKQEATERVLTALRKILAGEVYVSERLGAKLLNQMAGGRGRLDSSPIELLSDRELQIFSLIGQGHGTRAIAEQLHLSVKTIESHRAHIKEKLNLKNATELVHHAIQWAQSENPG